MSKTATRTASAKQSKKADKAKTIKVTEIDLGTQGKQILDQMAEHRQVRLAAQKEENLLKEELGELIESTLGRKQKKREKLLVRAEKVIRGSRSWRQRKNTDYDLLLQAFPEAYEATVSTSVYTQFDPA